MGQGRVALIVLDGVGIGAAPDAHEYGDAGSNTLGNVARAVGGLDLPHLASLGLGCCRPIEGLDCRAPQGAYGVALPASKGKDSTTGHWEICGVVLDRPFPTYATGFPHSVIAELVRRTGRDVIGNRRASGTEIIAELGAEQLERGAWIVYTSADSVFQIAAHEEVISLDELYAACAMARSDILVGEHAVARVIARPFVGAPGAFTRTGRRRDFSLVPPEPTLLDRLAAAGIDRVGIGKVDDLFAGRNITSVHPGTNAEAYAAITEALATMPAGLLFANVIDFDQSWGHRNDVAGFHAGLEELDRHVPDLLAAVAAEDLLIFTADHGNDPTTPSTDHSREAVPLLIAGPSVRGVALGERSTFADVGATIADYFGITWTVGHSMMPQLRA